MILKQHPARNPLPLGPVFTEPHDGRIETVQGDASASPESREFLAITENPIGDRLVPLNSGSTLVGVGEGDKLICAGHAVFLPLSTERSTVISPHAIQRTERYPYRMDKLSVIMSRIEPLMQELGLNPTSLSLNATGGRSRDLVRNWQRSIKDGKEPSARMESVALIAAALGVSDVWLATGQGQKDTLNDEERRLIEAYRAADDRGKRMLQALADQAADQPS